MIVNSDVDVYTKSSNHQKTFRKTQKNNDLLKPKRIPNTEVSARWEPLFYINLAQWCGSLPYPRQIRHWSEQCFQPI